MPRERYKAIAAISTVNTEATSQHVHEHVRVHVHIRVSVLTKCYSFGLSLWKSSVHIRVSVLTNCYSFGLSPWRSSCQKALLGFFQLPFVRPCGQTKHTNT